MALAFHAFAVFLGAIPARNLISATLGLPPQDYDLAVSLLAIFFYPLSWIFLVAVIFLAFYVVACLAGTVLFIAHQILGVPQFFFTLFSKSLQQSVDVLRAKINSVAEVSLMHGAGAAILSLSLVFALQLFTDFSHRSNRAVAVLVYFTDYHDNRHYPVVRPGVHSKVHGNGIVSYAYPQDSWHLHIEVKEVNDFSPSSGDYIPAVSAVSTNVSK